MTFLRRRSERRRFTTQSTPVRMLSRLLFSDVFHLSTALCLDMVAYSIPLMHSDRGPLLNHSHRFSSYLGRFESFFYAFSRHYTRIYAFFRLNVQSLRFLSLVPAQSLTIELIPSSSLISALSLFERSFCTFYDNFVSFPRNFSDVLRL